MNNMGKVKRNIQRADKAAVERLAKYGVATWLLYTYDAADEKSRLELGSRRYLNIKNKH